MEKYTGRKIAVLSDIHALKEPLEAVLEDITRRGINEIYSLGDNVGVGPNPSEVMDLLFEYNVKSIAGNSEEYITLGAEPFTWYFNALKQASNLWTISKLNEKQIGAIAAYPHSIELLIGGKKLALCHFSNDVRFDFKENDTWGYQANVWAGREAYQQFLYTNSNEQFEDMKREISNYDKDSDSMKGIISATKDPLFMKKRIDFFDAIIQGHVHWKLYEESDKTKFYSIRAVGMAYDKDPIDSASYVIINEKENGYDLEEVLVMFDREKMEYSILSSTSPDDTIKKFTNMK